MQDPRTSQDVPYDAHEEDREKGTEPQECNTQVSAQSHSSEMVEVESMWHRTYQACYNLQVFYVKQLHLSQHSQQKQLHQGLQPNVHQSSAQPRSLHNPFG